MPFSVELGPQPDKFIGKLDNQNKERIKNRLLKLRSALRIGCSSFKKTLFLMRLKELKVIGARKFLG